MRFMPSWLMHSLGGLGAFSPRNRVLLDSISTLRGEFLSVKQLFAKSIVIFMLIVRFLKFSGCQFQVSMTLLCVLV